MANAPTSYRPRNEEHSPTHQVADKAKDMADKAKDLAGNVADKARDMAGNVADKARDLTADSLEKAKDMASSAASAAGNAASNVGHKAEEATAAVGSGMKALASTLHDKGPREGMSGQASRSVAEALDSGGRYLEEHGLQGIGDDLTNLVRRNPLPALLIGIGVGYLLARATAQRS